MVYTVAVIMHYYPNYKKDDVLELSQSQISMLIEMIWCIENPENLKKYKGPPKFSSMFEFEQFLLNRYKL